MLTDVHCHVLSTYYDNIDEILSKINEYNIKRIFINGCNHQTNQEVVRLTKKYNNVYGSLGIHPTELNNQMEEALEYIDKNLNSPKIIAVGEIGLDYYWDEEQKLDQQKYFIKQLEIAKKHNKPVIIHSRKASDDVISILSKYKLRGIIHCFSSTLEDAHAYISLGYYLGIGGIVTFKNAGLAEILQKVNISNILLETDAPFITPHPYRKEKNEPKYLNVIAKKVAEINGLDEETLAQKLEENLSNIFDFSS